MTLIHGPNDAGKSSWHAALYFALCGVRRGKGRPTKDEQDLVSFHKPWDRDQWEVAVELVLELDGRKIELHQDLAGKVDCRAVDVVLGRDVSNEIMDGTPAASKWLGLDRLSFLATACVRQAD